MHHKHATETAPFMHYMESLVDIPKGRSMGDVLIHLNFLQSKQKNKIDNHYIFHLIGRGWNRHYGHGDYLLHVLIYKPRDLCTTLETTECCSLPNTSCDQLKRASRYLLTRRCNTHNNRCSPTLQRDKIIIVGYLLTAFSGRTSIIEAYYLTLWQHSRAALIT